MTRKLLAAAAFALLASTSVYAQSTAGGMMSNGYQMTATDALASKLIGSTVYSTMATKDNGAAATTTTAPSTAMTPASGAAMSTAPAAAPAANGNAAASASDTNAQEIGKIRDIIMGTDGKVDAVVIGIGGLLGLGEKNVAVAYTDLQWSVAQDGGIRGMLDTTADALKAAPDFQYPANGQATTAGATNAATTNAAQTASMAPAQSSTMTNAAAPAAAASNMNAASPATAPMDATAVTDPNAFAQMAAVSNMFEVQSSQLALKQSKTSAVTSFAQKMVDDHTKAGQDMDTAAQAEKVTPPTALDSAHQQQLDQLKGLSDTQFDQAYIPMQVTAHDDAVNLFQGYSQSGKAGPLKDFATKTLPTLQMHQQMIHSMAGK